MKTVAKILLSDVHGHILVLQRSSTHPHFAKQPDLPGGEVEDSESPSDALVREIKEETGLILKPAQIKQSYTQELPEVVHMVFTAFIDSASPVVNLSWEHDNAQWLAVDQVINKISKQGIDPYLKTVLDYLTQNINSTSSN